MKRAVAEASSLREENEELKERVAQSEQDSGILQSTGERELSKQIKKLTSQLQQQVTVNKTLSSKLLIQEKACIDEKRTRMELEKRYSAAVSSRPPSGPGDQS